MEAEDPVEGGKDGHVEAEPLLATLHLDDAKLLHDDVAGFCSVNSTLRQRAVQRNEYETQSYLEKNLYHKGWLAIAKLKPLSLFIFLF